MSAGAWDGLIVLIAGSPFQNPHGLRYASQHVAAELTRYAPVLYVDPSSVPTAIARRYGRGALVTSRLRVVQPRLAVLSTLAPPARLGRHVEPLVQAAASWSLRRAVRKLGGNVHAALLFSTAHHLFDACNPDLRVYYAKDDFSAAGDLLGGPAERIKEAEERAAEIADIVVAHSPALLERWQEYDPVFIPNGVDYDLFAGAGSAPRPADLELPGPVVTFVGNLTRRIDAHLLDAVAQRNHSLLLIGPKQPTFDPQVVEPLLARPNVQWLPGRPYESLPAYFGASAVGLVPYTDTQFNRASFPLKTLEYLAAGLPVVSSDLPSVRWLATDQVEIAGDPHTFGDAVDRAVEQSSDPALREQRQSFARGHDWANRVATLAAALGLSAPD